MTLRTFNSLDIRITLKVGFNRLTVGRIESRSTIAIGVNGYTTKATTLFFFEWRSAVIHRSK